MLRGHIFSGVRCKTFYKAFKKYFEGVLEKTALVKKKWGISSFFFNFFLQKPYYLYNFAAILMRSGAEGLRLKPRVEVVLLVKKDVTTFIFYLVKPGKFDYVR